MKPKHAMLTLCAYAVLLVLAASKFSMLSWVSGRWNGTWDYFQYSFRNGWGHQYHSEYPVSVVLTYLVAFGLGIVAHGMAGRYFRGFWNNAAMTLCALGLVSFAIEGSHWLWEHHLSWIAICPAANLLLAVVSIIRLGKTAGPIAHDKAPLPYGVHR